MNYTWWWMVTRLSVSPCLLQPRHLDSLRLFQFVCAALTIEYISGRHINGERGCIWTCHSRVFIVRTHRSEDSVGQSAGQRVETILVQLVSVVGTGFVKRCNNYGYGFYWFIFRTSYEWAHRYFNTSTHPNDWAGRFMVSPKTTYITTPKNHTTVAAYSNTCTRTSTCGFIRFRQESYNTWLSLGTKNTY